MENTHIYWHQKLDGIFKITNLSQIYYKFLASHQKAFFFCVHHILLSPHRTKFSSANIVRLEDPLWMWPWYPRPGNPSWSAIETTLVFSHYSMRVIILSCLLFSSAPGTSQIQIVETLSMRHNPSNCENISLQVETTHVLASFYRIFTRQCIWKYSV